MKQSDIDADLEFTRRLQVDWAPKIESIQSDAADSMDEPGLCADTIEPILREAFDAGRALGAIVPDKDDAYWAMQFARCAYEQGDMIGLVARFRDHILKTQGVTQ